MGRLLDGCCRPTEGRRVPMLALMVLPVFGNVVMPAEIDAGLQTLGAELGVERDGPALRAAVTAVKSQASA